MFRYSWSRGLRPYIHHLPSSLPSVPGPAGLSRAWGGAGPWASGRHPQPLGVGELLSNSHHKVRTCEPAGVAGAGDTWMGHQGLRPAPHVPPECLFQAGSSSLGVPCPSLLLSQEKTTPSAYPGPVCAQSLALHPPPARGHPGAGACERPQSHPVGCCAHVSRGLAPSLPSTLFLVWPTSWAYRVVVAREVLRGAVTEPERRWLDTKERPQGTGQ